MNGDDLLYPHHLDNLKAIHGECSMPGCGMPGTIEKKTQFGNKWCEGHKPSDQVLDRDGNFPLIRNEDDLKEALEREGLGKDK